MKRIRKGDEVIVIAGRSKGQRGHVLRVLKDQRLLVENVNMIKRHQKPDPQIQQPGGIIERESPIHASNVMLFNSTTGKSDSVGYKLLDVDRTAPFYRGTGEVVDI